MNTVLVDGNALLHRSYHAVKFAPTHNQQPVGAVYGFATALMQIYDRFLPEHWCVAFDTAAPTFRHQSDEKYKAHRASAPDDLYPQLPLVEELVNHFGITIQKKDGFEADDIIGTLATKSQAVGAQTYIISSDWDFLQLINPQTKLVLLKNLREGPVFDESSAEKELGITPAQVIDYKALVGDSADNYAGFPGVGPKTAQQWLAQYHTLDRLWEQREELAPRWKEALETHWEQVQHCRFLAQIKTDVPLEHDFASAQRWEPPSEGITEFLHEIGFSALARRWEFISNKPAEERTEQKTEFSAENSAQQLSLW